MGINGLIPFLEKASSQVHLKNLRGCTVAVDTYCWLHKGVYSCAEKLVRGDDTDLYVQYCLKYVLMLLSYDIKPILVFDGKHLPAKALTEQRRKATRQQCKKRASELLRLGRIDEASTQMRRCVDISHEMALRLIRECRKRNVDCIVAPYEADAQLAWFDKTDIAQYIITEDSDLTLFGAKRIIFKLDLTGSGLLIESNKFYLAMNCPLKNYNFFKFHRMCILSGCDYLDSLPGIGLAKACKFILKTEQEDMWTALRKIPQYLNKHNLKVTDEYIEDFLKAEATFRHMYIYNPLSRCMERLHALSEYDTDERYCSNAGTLLTNSEEALQLAVGNLDPFTLKKLDNWHPDNFLGMQHTVPKYTKCAKHKSIWQANYMPKTNITPDASADKFALHFKKVDFINQTIDADIAVNIRTEQAKPEESEIYNIYNKSTKRRKMDDTSMEVEKKHNRTSSIATTTNKHNPFATEKSLEILQKIENASLLRSLSPKKSKVDAESLTKKWRSAVERNILTTEHDTVPVEIRSRFFASNVQKITKVTAISSMDLTKEIDEIEKHTAMQKKMQAQLYSPPASMQNSKTTTIAETFLSRVDSGVECSTEEAKIKEATKLKTADENIICVSDESNQEAQFPQTTKLNNFRQFESKNLPRIGLSRTKTNGSSKKLTSTKSMKIAMASDQSQTRLSMFGFKKRAILK